MCICVAMLDLDLAVVYKAMKLDQLTDWLFLKLELSLNNQITGFKCFHAITMTHAVVSCANTMISLFY